MFNSVYLSIFNSILDYAWIYHSTRFPFASQKLFLIYQSVVAAFELREAYSSLSMTEKIVSFKWIRLILQGGSLITTSQNHLRVVHLIPWMGFCLSSGYPLFSKYIYGEEGSASSDGMAFSSLLLNSALQIHLFWKKRSESSQEVFSKTIESFLLEEKYDNIREIPEKYLVGPFVSVIPICPITFRPIRFAVIDPTCSKVFEKEALCQWVKENGTSPLTRQSLRLSQINPCHKTQFWINFFLRSISSYLKSKKIS